jgi:hypothetical protein
MFNHLNNNIDLTIPLYQEANDLEFIRRIRLQFVFAREFLIRFDCSLNLDI